MSRASHLAASAFVALVLSLSTQGFAWTPASLAMLQRTEPRIETLLDVQVAGVPNGSAKVTVERWTLRPNSQRLTVPAIDGLAALLRERKAHGGLYRLP